jgi:ferredoxin-fold anticodon binding domain-containing protein
MKIVGFYSGPDKYYEPPPISGVNIIICKINSRKFYFHTVTKVDVNLSTDFFSYSGEKNLEESNVLVSNKGIFVDWLATFPIFYSKRFNIITSYGGLFPKCKIEKKEFSYFLYAGRPLFNKTFFSNVSILQSSEYIKFRKNFTVEKLKNKEVTTSEHVDPKRILHDMSIYLNSKLKQNDKLISSIVIPLSGGNDSRLILSLIKPHFKSKSYAFTYRIGITNTDCQEVSVAQKISKALKIKHQVINLESSSIDYKIWHYFYGPFFQFNGMYYINAIRKIPIIDNSYFVSGIIGDIISGKHENIGNNLDKLLIRSKDGSYAKKSSILTKDFYKSLIGNIENIRKISVNDQEIAVRLKIQQLSFLISVPLHYGADILAPFTKKAIFRHISNLEYKFKNERLWQNNYFSKNKINVNQSKILYFNYTSFKLFASVPFFIRIRFIFINFRYFGISLNNLFFSIFMIFPILALPMFYPAFAKLLSYIGIFNPSLKAEKFFGIYFSEKK